MKITILTIGKRHEPWVEPGITRFLERLRAPFAAEMINHPTFRPNRRQGAPGRVRAPDISPQAARFHHPPRRARSQPELARTIAAHSRSYRSAHRYHHWRGLWRHRDASPASRHRLVAITPGISAPAGTAHSRRAAVPRPRDRSRQFVSSRLGFGGVFAAAFLSFPWRAIIPTRMSRAPATCSVWAAAAIVEPVVKISSKIR